MNYRVGVRTRILTALAHGVPVVASTAAALGLPELRDGVDIVYADNGPAVAGILSRLADDASLVERLGAAARTSWERFYDARVNVPALVDLADPPATE
jgi:glycosyltransferase involved in cell wall biosynthesis